MPTNRMADKVGMMNREADNSPEGIIILLLTTDYSSRRNRAETTYQMYYFSRIRYWKQKGKCAIEISHILKYLCKYILSINEYRLRITRSSCRSKLHHSQPEFRGALLFFLPVCLFLFPHFRSIYSEFYIINNSKIIICLLQWKSIQKKKQKTAKWKTVRLCRK
jgi:hypothetical protein